MILIAVSLLLSVCSKEVKNPLLEKWDTPFDTPPFDEIKNEHYLPAFNEAIKVHNEEIRKIIVPAVIPEGFYREEWCMDAPFTDLTMESSDLDL